MHIRCTAVTAAVLLTAGLTLTACGGHSSSAASPSPSASAASAPSTSEPVTARPSTLSTVTTSPPPASPTAKPTTARPSSSPTGCGPNRDVDVWYKVPGLPDAAQVLGSFTAATCGSTFAMLKTTSPTDAGYCTEAAWASDNPDYNADAEPAKRLKHVQMAVGPAC